MLRWKSRIDQQSDEEVPNRSSLEWEADGVHDRTEGRIGGGPGGLVLLGLHVLVRSYRTVPVSQSVRVSGYYCNVAFSLWRPLWILLHAAFSFPSYSMMSFFN